MSGLGPGLGCIDMKMTLNFCFGRQPTLKPYFFSFFAEGHRKLVTDVFISSSFSFFFLSSILGKLSIRKINETWELVQIGRGGRQKIKKVPSFSWE